MCIEALEAMLQCSQQDRPGPRVLLWCIGWHINRDSGDWPITIGELMRETGLGKRQVYEHLRTLESSGELIIAHRRNRANIYRLAYFAGRFAELSTDDELSTVVCGIPQTTVTNNLRNSANNSAVDCGIPQTTAGLFAGERKQQRRIPYTGISLPEEERPEGDPYANSVENLIRSRQGPFAAWQRAQAAQRRAQ